MCRAIVEIKNPCKENLTNMSPDSKGKFCKVCQTSVIDFTDKTPKEISLYFLNHNNEKICGIFVPQDVKTDDKPYVITSFFNTGKLKYISVLIFGILILMGCRTRKTRTGVYGSPRFLDKNNPSIENLK